MVAPLPFGMVVKVGVRVSIMLPFESTPVIVGDDRVPPLPTLMVAVKFIVLSSIGWLNVMLRTPLDVIVPSTEFDAEVAKSELPVKGMFTTRVVVLNPVMKEAVVVVASCCPSNVNASTTIL